MSPKILSFKISRSALALAVLAMLITSMAASAASGSLDVTFGSGGVVVADFGSPSDTGNRIALSADGSKIYGLGTTVVDSVRRPVIVRYFNNSVIDNSFDGDGKLIVAVENFGACDFDIQSDGKVVVAGATARDNYTLVRYLSNGVLDTTFGENGIATLSMGDGFQIWCNDMALQPDQKIIVFGSEITTQSNHTDFFVTRFNTDGSPDETFVAHGFNIIDKSYFPMSQFNYGWGIAVQPDGKIILAGGMQDYEGDSQISLARLNANGFLDTSFGVIGEGTVTEPLPGYFMVKNSVALQTDGKIVVAGTASDGEGNHRDLALARFNPNGTLDSSFGSVIADFGEEEETSALLLQKDGKIVLVGNMSNGTDSQFLLVRYNPDGSLDTSFGSNGKVTSDFGAESVDGATLQADGKLLAIGTSANDLLIARYDMGSTGAVPLTKTFSSNAIQDGWILETSESSALGGAHDTLSTTFNVGDDNKDRQYRSILSFQTASLPDNAVIASAVLKIKRQGLVGADPFTTHGNLLVEIRQGAFNKNLALEAADFSASASSAFKDAFTPSTTSWYIANLTSPNLPFVNLFGLTQFRLRFALDDNDDLNADTLKFFSGNSTDANRPRLIVTYYLP
jgi:uncharacterized delta-60 repeat protein